MNQVVNTVKQRASAQLDTQKGRATDGLDAVTQAVRQTTEQLRAQQHDTLAQYIDTVADQLERVSTGVREKSVEELMRDVQQFARRQPALFIGGSFAVGLLAARFLQSSQRNGEQWQGEPDTTGPYGGSPAMSRTYAEGTGSPWTEPVGRERF
jgi:hypothetical protein